MIWGLVPFLRARLDEDEAVAYEVRDDQVGSPYGPENSDKWLGAYSAGDDDPVVAMAISRLLAEVKAKRRIINLAELDKNHVRRSELGGVDLQHTNRADPAVRVECQRCPDPAARSASWCRWTTTGLGNWPKR